ncbi:MAG TPA: EAL domain-containing protein [Granulicella sp.]|nr:EAL domain-containing protein [Granulicella sp.]
MTVPLTQIDTSTILIVDDIPVNLAIAVAYLEANNFQLVVAQDGEEGIERAQRVHPDLILLDVMMPGIDGFETCRRLKMDAATSDIPVIFMTALADTSDKVTAFAAGAVDYVSKPFHVEELLARIRTHLTLRAAQKQLAAQNRQLQASGVRYRRLFETAKDGILLLDSESGRVTDVNQSVIQMLGYSRDHFLNHKLWDVRPFLEVPECRHGLTELQTAESIAFDHWILEAQDKSIVDVEFVGNVYQVDGARIVQCNLRDITSRKQAEARIHYMALHDALTGLPNRALLQDRLTQAMTMASRNHTRVAVLMLDLDQFKHINDSLGHHVGDRVLEAVSARIKTCLRESDIVARLGGDEFVVALPTVTDDQDIEGVAQKLLTSLLDPFQVEGNELKISGSIGIGQYPADGDTPGALLRAADTAMYAAKARGRGVHCFFTPELDVQTQRRIMLVSDLCTACERNQLAVHYQPLVGTSSGVITAVEALLRWNHPRHGQVSPAEFIPLLEETGMIVGVGKWVLKTACMQNAAWQKAGLPPIRMAVNVSAHQFYRGDLVRVVEEALAESELDPKWLDLELTETLTLDGSETTINIMEKLKSMGVGLSLDDFGTGWSSLSCLRRFPLDRIKIDRSFMRDIMSQPAAKAVVTSIIDLARNLGFDCIAEGVETEEQLKYLELKACPEIQGFLYSPALPASACGDLILTGKLGFRGTSKNETGEREQAA